MEQLNAISFRQRQHLSCIISMVTDASIRHIYYEEFLSAREIQRYRKKPFGITHLVYVSAPIMYAVMRHLKVPLVVPKYRNSEFHLAFRALVATKRVSRIFDFSNLRTGKLCDLPILKHWEKTKSLLCGSDSVILSRLELH